MDKDLFKKLLVFYCESSEFTVKKITNTSTSPLAGQPALMHINTHAPWPFIYRGALPKRMGIYDKNVIAGAGMRIRRLAKAADEMMPTKRVIKIAEIHGCFRNPAKGEWLTVDEIIHVLINVFEVPANTDMVNGVFRRLNSVKNYPIRR